MDGVKEYIFPVYDVDSDEFKEYIGFIRTKPELIRCKDCRWFINKECAIYCLSSAHEETFCSYAEPKDSTAEVRRQLKETEQRKEMERKK